MADNSNKQSAGNSFRRGNNVIQEKTPLLKSQAQQERQSRSLEAIEARMDALLQQSEAQVTQEQLNQQTNALSQGMLDIEIQQESQGALTQQQLTYSAAQVTLAREVSAGVKELVLSIKDIKEALQGNVSLEGLREFLAGTETTATRVSATEEENELAGIKSALEEIRDAVPPAPETVQTYKAAEAPEKEKSEKVATSKSDSGDAILNELRSIRSGIGDVSASAFQIATGMALQTAKLLAALAVGFVGFLALSNVFIRAWEKYGEKLTAAWESVKEQWESVKAWFSSGDGKLIADALKRFSSQLLDGDIKAAFLGLFEDAGQILQNGLMQGFEAVLRLIPGLSGTADTMRYARIQSNLNAGIAPTKEDKEFYETHGKETNTTVLEKGRTDNYYKMLRNEFKKEAGLSTATELFYSDAEKEKLKEIDTRIERHKLQPTAPETQKEQKELLKKYPVLEAPETFYSSMSIEQQQKEGRLRTVKERIEKYGENETLVKELHEAQKELGISVKESELKTEAKTKTVPTVYPTDRQADVAPVHNTTQSESTVANMVQQVNNTMNPQTIVMASRTRGNRVQLNA